MEARTLFDFPRRECAKRCDGVLRHADPVELRQIVVAVIDLLERHAGGHAQHVAYRRLAVGIAREIRYIFGDGVVERSDLLFSQRHSDREADDRLRHRMRNEAVFSVAVVLITLGQHLALPDQQEAGHALARQEIVERIALIFEAILDLRRGGRRG